MRSVGLMSWGGLLSVIAAATLVAGCEMGRASTSGRADLQVLLRTDLTPQVEFVWIEVALPETGEVMRRAAVPVAYHRAAEVAYFRDLRPNPERLVEVRLLQRDGSVVLKRPLVFPHRGRLAVTARLTRSCREHDCPAACHGGFCVDPRCIDGDEVLCREGPDAPDVPRPGHVRECDTVADCALPVAACAIQVCDEGLCWAFPDDGACPEGRLCAPDIGCRDAPPPLEVDAGMPDAGPPLEDGGGGPALCPPLPPIGLSGEEVVAGEGFACARGGGQLHCWGANDHGQLGDLEAGGPAPRAVAVGAPDALWAGAAHACARSAGAVWCWGANETGQVVPGAGAVALPTDIGLSEVLQLGAGARHSCAVRGDGSLWCWGDNAEGQLGVGDREPRDAPVKVDAIAGARFLGAADRVTCAAADGGVFCFGADEIGVLGLEGVLEALVPTLLSELVGVKALARGADHTCALHEDGRVSCWGANAEGQLGDGSGADRALPRYVVGLEGVVAIGAGDAHSCAITGGGALWCWGDNASGQLGDGTFADRDAPVRVVGEGAADVALGADHTCAVIDGGAYCFGAADDGRLGVARVEPSPCPLPVEAPAPIM